MSTGAVTLRLAADALVRLPLDGSDDIVLACGRGARRQELRFNSELLVAWLLWMRHPRSMEDAVATAAETLKVETPEAEMLVRRLEEEEVILRSGTGSEVERDANGRAYWIEHGWRDAFDFHAATSDLPFEMGDDLGFANQVTFLKAQSVREPSHIDDERTAAFKNYAGVPRIALAKSDALVSAVTFQQALTKRRTCRAFDGASISFQQCSELLLHSIGMTGMIRSEALGDHILRTSPSGGARHPIEAYPIVFNVESIAPGLYHYCVEHHALEQLKLGPLANEVYEIGHRQRGLKGPALAVLFTIRWPRHVWKYRYARSYRMALYDLGHIVQTHLLTASAVGLRSFLTPAIDDQRAQDLLSIPDRWLESAMYLTCVG